MNKKSKIKMTALSAGTIGAMAIPLSMAVSCGTNHIINYIGGNGANQSQNFEIPNFNSERIINLDDSSLAVSSFKKALLNAQITESEVESLTVEDVHMFLMGKNPDKNKLAVVEKIKKVLLHWAFENNGNKEIMSSLNNWVNNSGLMVFASQSAGRGVVKSSAEQGSVSYKRNDLSNLKTNKSWAGVDLVSSKISGKNKILTDYNKIANSKPGKKITDANSFAGNGMTTTNGAATSFSIFRTAITGNDVPVTDPTGSVTFSEEMKLKSKLFDGLDVELGTIGNNGLALTNQAHLTVKTIEGLKASFSTNTTANTIIFKTASKKVNYAIANGGSITDSNKQFRAKDMFYGFVRSLYNNSSVWKKGVLNGQDISSYLPIYNSTEEETFLKMFIKSGDTYDKKVAEKASHALQNPNLYLLDLFNIDLIKTLKANMETADEDKFAIVFKNDKIPTTTTELFKDNTLFTPFPKSEIIGGGIQNKKLTGENLKIFGTKVYGHPYTGSGVSEPSDVYSIAPYLYTKYDLGDGGDGVETKLNEFYIDNNFVTSKNVIKGTLTIMTKKSADASAQAQARKVDFENANKTGIYLLPSEVYSQKTLLESLSNYKMISKSMEIGAANGSKLYWNIFGHTDPGYNDIGRKMMWGVGSSTSINTSKNATAEFMSGTGALVRDSIHAAINWQALVETIAPGQGKEYYPSIALPASYDNSGVSRAEAFPSFLFNQEKAQNIYDSNLGNNAAAWTAPTLAKAAKTLDVIAMKSGATESNPASIPIFKYIFTDNTPKPSDVKANQQIIDRLNKMTKLVHFTNQKDYAWGDFITAAYRTKIAGTLLSGFGPDYRGLGSIIQQMLDATGGVIGLAKDAFKK